MHICLSELFWYVKKSNIYISHYQPIQGAPRSGKQKCIFKDITIVSVLQVQPSKQWLRCGSWKCRANCIPRNRFDSLNWNAAHPSPAMARGRRHERYLGSVAIISILLSYPWARWGARATSVICIKENKSKYLKILLVYHCTNHLQEWMSECATCQLVSVNRVSD